MSGEPPAVLGIEIVHRIRQENSSSIEIGTPGKTGCLKIFFDPSDGESAERRLREGIRILSIARGLFYSQNE